MTGTTQRTAFGPLTIEYDDRVLRPRDWTRAQSAWAAELLTTLPPGGVLELCSGAGHIGLLAVAGTDRRLLQVDADAVACGFARANADRARNAGDGWSVEVRHGWLEEALEPQERFVLVIADPPWVTSVDTARHPQDPITAIDGGPDGLVVVRSSLAVTGRHLAHDGAALLQVGDAAQARRVDEHLRRTPGLALRTVEIRTVEGGALMHLVRRV